MLKSKNVKDYFDAPLLALRPDEAVPFDIYLYFSISNHILLWRAKGEVITGAFIERYQSRKVEKIWIHQSDAAVFAAYKAGSVVATAEAPATSVQAKNTSVSPAPTSAATAPPNQEAHANEKSPPQIENDSKKSATPVAEKSAPSSEKDARKSTEEKAEELRLAREKAAAELDAKREEKAKEAEARKKERDEAAALAQQAAEDRAKAKAQAEEDRRKKTDTERAEKAELIAKNDKAKTDKANKKVNPAQSEEDQGDNQEDQQEDAVNGKKKSPFGERAPKELRADGKETGKNSKTMPGDKEDEKQNKKQREKFGEKVRDKSREKENARDAKEDSDPKERKGQTGYPSPKPGSADLVASAAAAAATAAAAAAQTASEKNPVETTKNKKTSKKEAVKKAAMIDAITSKEISPEERNEILSQGAGGILADATQAKTTKGQSLLNKKTRDTVRELLKAGKEEEPVVKELFDLADHIPELEHSVEVATYAILFAMLSGKSDSITLSDLAVAGLVHDVGLCMFPLKLQRKPWTSLSEPEHKIYRTHVEEGRKWLAAYAPEVTSSQMGILQKHHEKFDGTGYPNSEKGFSADETPQFLAMSDLIITIGSGNWDGEKRPVGTSIEFISDMEKKQNFPQFFNPELLSRVLEWGKKPTNGDLMESALKIAQAQKSKILKDAA